MKRNLIVDGALNVGKTKNILFPLVSGMIDRKESFIVSDSKKEYYNYFSEKAKENGYNTIVINIQNPSKSNSIDLFELPYRYYTEGNKMEAYRILDDIVKNVLMNDRNRDPFWGMSASSLILAILVKIMEDGNKDELNFKSVYNVLTKFSHLENTLLNNYFNTPSGSALYQGAASVLNMPLETKESVIAVAKQLLFDNIIFDDTLNMISNASFKLDNIDEKPIAMFVITSNINYDRNILFNMIFSEMNYVFRNSSKKFNIILDNFDELNIYCFNELFASSNSYDIDMFVVTRDINGLIKMYGDYLFKVAEVMYVGEKIRKVFDSKEEIIDNNFEDILIEKKELPQLEIGEIKTFNIYEHISKELIDSIASKDEIENL